MDPKKPPKSTAEPVQSPALPLQSVDHVHRRHRLPPRVLGVCHGVADHVLQENLEDAASLLVDEPADPLHAATPGKAADGRLRDPLYVVAEHLPVPLRSALAQPLSALSSARHL
ncbi:hypothetical protein RHGRI_015203 [Rhododendron griersonianum]|uniref:Uncharacterized protein n=1 Tax=Rhododendron griersonianum TaxID=479676 RepID=A0AAV6KCD6_9ERIC|nr:hypothetical protein RHGRI_015203 [Rhododendron griersonianum]